MKRLMMCMAAAIALSATGWAPLSQAGVPPLGSREGELLCAGWTNVLASGTMLTTGGDAATAIKAHGVFLGRLSLIAPDTRYRLQEYLDAYGRMTPAEQDQLGESCLAKLREIDAVGGPGPKEKDR